MGFISGEEADAEINSIATTGAAKQQDIGASQTNSSARARATIRNYSLTYLYMSPEPEQVNFSKALELMKEGKKVCRAGWKNPCIKVFVQFPDEHSANTLPYLVMEKYAKGNESYARFPLDLSAESIFAEDWFVTHD